MPFLLTSGITEPNSQFKINLHAAAGLLKGIKVAVLVMRTTPANFLIPIQEYLSLHKVDSKKSLTFE